MQRISTGLPKGKLEQTDTCKGCTLGKYAKDSFQGWDSRAGAILERVHSDVFGGKIAWPTLWKGRARAALRSHVCGFCDTIQVNESRGVVINSSWRSFTLESFMLSSVYGSSLARRDE